MKSFGLIFIALILAFQTFGQTNITGIPFSRFYPPKEYNDAHPFNWCVVQDHRGFVYVGNNLSCVLEYDGNFWNSIPIPGDIIVRSLAVDEKGTVYVGAIGEFGFLAPDKNGKLVYKSISQRYKEKKIKLEDVWKTFVADSIVYFCTPTVIYKYEPGKSLSLINLKQTSFLSFNVFNKTYIGNYDDGLMGLKNNEPAILPGGENFKEKNIAIMKPYGEDNILIGTNPGGLFIYDTKKGAVTPFAQTPVMKNSNNFLIENTVYNGTIFNNNFALATLGNGIIFMDEKGNIKNHLTKNLGMPSETASDIFNNPTPIYNGITWVTLTNGLVKIEANSPIKKIDSEFGLSGDINAITRFNSTLYVATIAGVFYLDISNSSSPVFKKIPGIDNALSFLKFKAPKGKEILLVGAANDIFEIRNNTPVSINSNFVNTFNLIQSKKDSSLIFAATSKGPKIRKYDNKLSSWVKFDSIKGITEDANSIAEDKDGNIWVSTILNGVYKIDATYKIKHFDTTSGFKTMIDPFVFSYNENVIVGTPNGIYKRTSDDKFVPFNDFGKKYADGKTGIFRIFDGPDNSNWLCLIRGKKRWIEAVKKSGKNYENDSISFFRFPSMYVQNIYNDADGVTWIASSEGLFTYDNHHKKNYFEKYKAAIRSIIIGEDSILFAGTFYKKISQPVNAYSFDSLRILFDQPEDMIPILDYKYNNLKFYYSCPFYEDEASTVFSYFLEGNDEGWSKWTKETKAIYTNLYEGEYTFKIKAKNVYGIESEIASYYFKINPPWYRTWWAYISYVILLVAIIWGIVAIATYRMKQLNIAYGRYLPGSFLKLLDKAKVIDLRLGDLTEKEVTIMFSDIRSYTNLSESMQPHDNFRFLVSYLSKIGDMLHKNTGFPVQYYGDGIMAMFHGDTDNAVQAAIDMHKKVLEYSEERKAKGRRELRIGVGLHTGKIVMGIRGDARRWEGGIVGDSVNLAARMEGLTKMYGAWTMLTDDTFKKLKNPKRFNIRFLGKVKVKGKDIPVGIYELIDGLEKELFDLKMKTKAHFDAALDYFFEKDLEKAKELFSRVIDANPGDIAASHYIEVINKLLIEGIPKDFDGVEKLDKK